MSRVRPHDQGTFLVTSSRDPGVEYLVDLQGARQRPECACEVFDFFAPQAEKEGLPPPVCQHIRDVFEYLGVPLPRAPGDAEEAPSPDPHCSSSL